MESENVMEQKDEGVKEETHNEAVLLPPCKEQHAAEGEVPINSSEISKNEAKPKGLSSDAPIQTTLNVSESKAMYPRKKGSTAKGATQKISKLANDKPPSKGSGPLSANRKPVLSQSLSFPSTGVHADKKRKSVEVHPLKYFVNHSQDGGIKPQVPSNGSVSRLYQPTKHLSSAGYSKQSNVDDGSKTSSRHKPLTNKPATQLVIFLTELS